MTQERKDELHEQMLTWICENSTDDALFHLLHDQFGMTKEELHDHSIESLDEFFHEDGQPSASPYGENQVDGLCSAVGHEISDTSDEELERGVQEQLGLPLDENTERRADGDCAGMELSDFISEVSGMVNSEDKSAVLDWVSLAAFLADMKFKSTTLENELRELYLPLCYVRNNFSDYVLQQSLAMDTHGSEVVYGAMLFAAGYSALDMRELGDRGVLMNGYVPLAEDEKGSLSVVSLSESEDILFIAQNEEADHILKCVQKAAGLAKKDGVSIQTILRDTAPAWLRLKAVTDPALMDAIKISCTASTAISDITVYDQASNTVTQHSTKGLTTEQREAIFCCGEAPEMTLQM